VIGQAFDEKNQDDFEDVTERINEALLKIASDPSVKATATELSKISGVHRNTISNRGWPVERIKQIKAQRSAEAERRKKGDSLEPKPVDVLTDKLEKAHLEIMFWFKKYQDATKLYEGATESVKYLAKSRDTEKRKVEALEENLEKLKAEYERVCDLLNTVNDR